MRILVKKSLFLAVAPLAFSIASAEFPPGEDQPLALQRTEVTAEFYDAGGTIALEQLEQYARDIVPTYAGEKARVEAGLADKLGSMSCQDAVVEGFEGASNCVRSLTENGELVRQYVEAKFLLEHAKWRVTGGAHALVKARELLNPGDTERLQRRQARGLPLSDSTFRLEERVQRVQRAVDNALQRYNRAVAARDAIAKRVPVLRQMLVEKNILQRTSFASLRLRTFYFGGVVKGIDYESVAGPCLGKRAC